MLDMKNDIDMAVGIAPAAARTTTTTGTGVDLAAYGAATVFFQPATITDYIHTPSVDESADNSSWTAVAAGDLIGTLAVLASNTIQRVGYNGTKRYIRAVITVSSTGSTGGVYAAQIVRGHAAKAPLA